MNCISCGTVDKVDNVLCNGSFKLSQAMAEKANPGDYGRACGVFVISRSVGTFGARWLDSLK